MPAYLPFGGGPRVCIGLSFALAEAQIVLAWLLTRYHLSLCNRSRFCLGARDNRAFLRTDVPAGTSVNVAVTIGPTASPKGQLRRGRTIFRRV